MKLRISNYRRFILMAILCSLLLFLLAWGTVYLIQTTLLADKPVSEDKNVEATPEDVNSLWLIVINQDRPLDETYEPSDLVEINVKTDTPLYMVRDAAIALEGLVTKAESEGIDLKAISAYRSFNDQQALYDAEENISGYVTGVESVAAGQSEHQTGLAVDLSTADIGYALDTSFKDTPAGQWLITNAPEYGFILRYPQGKEMLTGNVYEPWHFRYVGVEDAKKMTLDELTLEEYTNKTSDWVDENSTNTTKTE